MSEIYEKLRRGTCLSRDISRALPQTRNYSRVGNFEGSCRIVTSEGDGYDVDSADIEFYGDFVTYSRDRQIQGEDGLEWLARALAERYDIKKPSPVQKYVIPLMLKGKDVTVVAPTGSGKTLAYLVPIIARLFRKDTLESTENSENRVKALIVVPTVELAHQIRRECIYLMGNESIRVSALEKSCKSFNFEIATSTPLTLLKILESNKEAFYGCEFLVLDEADRLFDKGYCGQLDGILSKLKRENMQKSLFSSTMQRNVLDLASSFMPCSIYVTIGSGSCACGNVEQEFVCVTSDEGKLPTLRQFIAEGRLVPPILIFLQTVDRVNSLYNKLSGGKLAVERFTGEIGVERRLRIIEDFRVSKIWVLLCTDILSRGIDFRGVESVVNFDFPQSCSDYVNRVGRAGRGQKIGKAITFYTLNDLSLLKPILTVVKLSGQSVPDWLFKAASLKGRTQRRKRQRQSKKTDANCSAKIAPT